MALVLAIAALVGLALVALDIVGLQQGDDTRSASVPRGGLATPVGALGIAYGFIALPGSLAPVISLSTALRRPPAIPPLLGDGWTALLAVVLAFVAISAALKASRVGRWILTAERPSPDLARTLRFLRLWWLLVGLLLIATPFSRLPTPVAGLVVGFAALSLATGAGFELALRGTIPASGSPARDDASERAANDDAAND